MSNVPMKVTIKLQAPIIVGEFPQHLDGVLAGILVRQAEDRGDENPWAAGDSLPLEKYVSPDGEWVWKASMLRPSNRLTEGFPITMTSRINLQRAAEDRDSGLLLLRSSKPNTAGGPFKGSIFAETAQWIDELVAFAVGDIDAVQEILANLEFIGSRRAQCFGRVASFKIEPEDGAGPLAWAHRTMPIGSDLAFPQSMQLAVGNTRAPYWLGTTKKSVLTPVAF